MEYEKMIDVHMHLIPGVDDGAMDSSMAASMVYTAWHQGIEVIFATPHSSAYDQNPELVWKRYEDLVSFAEQIFLPREFPGLRILPGCEVMCDIYAMEEILRKLETGVYPTMNGTKYVLTEFSPRTTAQEALAGANALAGAGWKPMIAHMERYPSLRDCEFVDAFRALGCLIQINAYSLEEEADPAIKAFARTLVQKQKVDFLGTDAHQTTHRAPAARAGIRWIYETCGPDYAHSILRGNAETYLIGKKV